MTMNDNDLDKLLDKNLDVAFKNLDKVSENNSVKEDNGDTIRIKQLIEAIRSRPVTQADVEAFEQRCRAREKEFKRISDHMRPDAACYNFQYGIKNNAGT